LRTRRLGHGTASGADTCSLGSAGELGQSRARYGCDSAHPPPICKGKDNPGSRPSPLCTGPEIGSGDPKARDAPIATSRVGSGRPVAPTSSGHGPFGDWSPGLDAVASWRAGPPGKRPGVRIAARPNVNPS
jgi:hypothetical protein